MTTSKPECGCHHTLKYGEFKNDPQPFKIIRLPFDHPEDVQRFTGQHRYSKYADKGHIGPRRITNNVKGAISDWTISPSICWRKGLTSVIVPPIAGYGAADEQLKISMAAAQKRTLGWGEKARSRRTVLSFERPV
ncbi:hypothetical protein DPX16_0709 [Anabarilius grahami]|uniref:Uncharacterized protein n=1 Tax=Anabarilius grahami TaxID=495550 RepID=A0A3N0YC35_ANAGA|nr:hypothetical protein DPX16_0709 [Anabarilius grahami]